MSAFKPQSAALAPQQAQGSLRLEDKDFAKNFFSLVAIHVIIGFALAGLPQFSTFYAFGTVIVGAFWGLAQKGNTRLAFVSAYIVGCEVLWRMLDAGVVWEFGKYALTVIMVLGILRSKSVRVPVISLAYFTFLLPAILLTLDILSGTEARNQISFNLSGPLALFVASIFFITLEIDRRDLQKLLASIVAPIISMAVILLINIVSISGNLRWVDDSNFQTSGGFGPNQISSALSLGGIALWFLFTLFPSFKISTRIILMTLSLWLLTQSMLTFSRGGMYSAVASMICLIIYLVISRKRPFSTVLSYFAAIGIFLLLVFPYIDGFTNGKLGRRFTDTNTTNRAELVDIGIQIFLENPFTGVGVGISKQYATEALGIPFASHTEYSRMLAEHGILGLGALMLLGAMIYKNFYRSRKTTIQAALVIAFSSWALVYMLTAAMRTGAPGFLIGLCFVTLEEPIETEKSVNRLKSF